MPDQANLEAPMIAQAIALGLSTQLQKLEGIEVSVKTNLLNVLQGQAENLAIAGTGLESFSGLSVQELELQADSIGIKPLKALFGKLELSQPVDATIRLVLSETDLERAINTTDISEWLLPKKFQVNGQAIALTLAPPVSLKLPGAGKIIAQGRLEVQQPQPQQYEFVGIFQHRSLEQPILIEKFTFAQDQGLSLDLLAALLERFQAIGHQRYFRGADFSWKINALEVQTGQLVLEAEVQLHQIP